MTRPLDTCWAVVHTINGRQYTATGLMARTRVDAIKAYVSRFEGAPYNDWPYHYRRGMRCIRVDVVPH